MEQRSTASNTLKEAAGWRTSPSCSEPGWWSRQEEEPAVGLCLPTANKRLQRLDQSTGWPLPRPSLPVPRGSTPLVTSPPPSPLHPLLLCYCYCCQRQTPVDVRWRRVECRVTGSAPNHQKAAVHLPWETNNKKPFSSISLFHVACWKLSIIHQSRGGAQVFKYDKDQVGGGSRGSVAPSGSSTASRLN